MTGCEQLQRDNSRTYTNGSTIYSYYPSSCGIIKDNAFVYLSGTSLFGGETDSGVSITHILDRSLPLQAKDDVYYYRKIDTTGDGNIDKMEHLFSKTSKLGK